MAEVSPCWAIYLVNLLTFGPFIARLLNGHGPFLAHLVFSNEKACLLGGLFNLWETRTSHILRNFDRANPGRPIIVEICPIITMVNFLLLRTKVAATDL